LSEIHLRITAGTLKNNALRAFGNTIAAACALVREKWFRNRSGRPERRRGEIRPAAKEVPPGQIDCLTHWSAGAWRPEEHLHQPDHQAITSNEDDRKDGKQENSDKQKYTALATFCQYMVVVRTTGTHSMVSGCRENPFDHTPKNGA
jgi:hypothetical protein